MSYATESAFIRTRVNTLWVDNGSPRTAVAWENVGFSSGSEPWIRVRSPGIGSDRVSLGPGPIYRHDGMVIIEVFTPLMGGQAANDALCDHAAAMFRGVVSSGFHFGAPYRLTVGNTDGWFKQDVLCPYLRDTVF